MIRTDMRTEVMAVLVVVWISDRHPSPKAAADNPAWIWMTMQGLSDALDALVGYLDARLGAL